MEHTDDCLGGEECQPRVGTWRQPPRIWVDAAEDQLANPDKFVPWCQIQHRAIELQEQDEEDE